MRSVNFVQYDPIRRFYRRIVETSWNTTAGADELARSLDGDLSREPALLAAAADDFGHIVRRPPVAVVRPKHASDIATTVRWAAAHGLTVAPRGQGHSVYGRSQAGGGVVVDMSGHNRVHRVEADRVIVDAGATWQAVLTETLPHRRTPPVLTDFLGLSVGGTVSAGGIGGRSHRYGSQACNVLELDVVTGNGDEVTCSPSANADLFDAMRAGLSQ